MLVRAERFDRVMDRFYEAAGLPELWPAALDELAQACGGGGAVINSTLVRDGHPVCSASLAEVVHRHVTEDWQARNTRLLRGIRLFKRGHRGLITENHLFTPEEWRADPLLNELALPSGYCSFGGMILARAGDDLLPVSVELRTTSGAYSEGDIAAINRLLARLQPAGALALRVGILAAAAVAQSLARPGEAIVLVNANGKILHEAPAIDPAFADVVRSRAGRLACLDPAEDAALQAAIARAVARAPVAERTPGRITLKGPGGTRAVTATIVPLRGAVQDVYLLARAIVILADREALRPRNGVTALLERQLGLTSAESRLALRLVDGQSLREIADAEHVTFETVRSRLKSVLAKTGTNRQAQLVILVERLTRT